MEEPLPGGGSTEADGNSESQALFEKMLREQMGEDAYNASGAGGDGKEDEQPESVPLESRLRSAKWEFRAHGYSDLKSQFENCAEISEELLIHADAFPSWLADRNANAQRAAIESVSSFFAKCSPPIALSTWAPTLSVLFEKCMSQPRLLPGTLSLMANVLTATECPAFQEPVYVYLDKFLDKKGNAAVRGPVAKQISGLLNSLEKLIRLFGVSKFDLPSLLPRVSKYTAVTDNATKQAAYGLLREVFIWLRNTDLVTCYVADKQKVSCQ